MMFRRNVADLAVAPCGSTVIHPQYLTRIVNEVAADDAIFTCDVGTPTVWAARCLMMKAVLDRRGDEIEDLARTNFLR